MKSSYLPSMLCMLLYLSLFGAGTPVSAQDQFPELSNPINLDEALREPVPADRAASYYYFALSKLNSGNGNLAEGLKLMKKALDYNRDSSEIHMELAMLLGNIGKSQEAVKYAQEASRLDPKDPAPHWVLARIYLNTRLSLDGEFEKAVRELETIRELDPQNGNVYYALGGAYFELNEPGKAIQAYEKFQNIIKDTDSGYVEIARYYYANKNTEKTIEYLKKALLLQPESIDSLNFLGEIYTELRRIQDAIPIYRKLVQEIDDNQNLKRYLASLLYEEGEYQEAGDLMEEVLEIEPTNNEARLLLGRIYIEQNEYSKAIEIFRDLLESNPSEIDLYIYLSQIYLQAKRFPEAENILQQAEKIESGDETSREQLKIQRVSIHEKQKDYVSAESLLKEILKENPNHAGALNYLGYMLADRGIMLTEALDYIKNALEIDPDNGAYLDSLGWVYFKLNDLENAEIYLLRAGKREKDDPVINDHLGELYYKTGDFEKASNFWKQSIRLSTEPEDIQKVQRKLDILQGNIKKQ